jgi:LysR family glycine cleavage system transcriptional activator
MQRLPPLTWTRTFEAAARLLSFTAAARELGITQSAVSQQIRLLEAHLGQSLFARRGRGMVLTETGSRLYPSIRGSFDGLQRAYSPYLSDVKGYTVWVSSNISFLMLWLLPRIPRYRDNQPLVDFRFNTTRWSTDPKNSGASVEILYGDGEWALPSEIISRNVMFPVCTPGVARRIREPMDVMQADLITTHGEEHLWAEWAQSAGASEAHTRYRVDLHMAALELARLGHGVALANDLLAADLLATGQLVIPFASWIYAKDNYYLSFRETSASGEKGADFSQWLKQDLQAHQRAFRATHFQGSPT